MYEITLEWQENNHHRIEIIRDQQPSKNPGTVRLGRDPVRCDLVLNEPTVSGLHVEIFFNLSTSTFGLRNLRNTNPPLVDGRQITQGEAPLNQGSIIYLGQMQLKVVAVSLVGTSNLIPKTILMPPAISTTAKANQSAPDGVSYGLNCPNCGRVSHYERLALGCKWCGTSLAAARSVLMTPEGQ
ncbi:FHA domain-containing protein [Lyngbya aestuarii]|uniref:FHA domain-containing protein n=1 Tax=Lyngbya aestuarii TaxID=118322 RepID=UPI00403D7D2B